MAPSLIDRLAYLTEQAWRARQQSVTATTAQEKYILRHVAREHVRNARAVRTAWQRSPQCRDCHQPLTDPASIRRRRGPECERKAA